MTRSYKMKSKLNFLFFQTFSQPVSNDHGSTFIEQQNDSANEDEAIDDESATPHLENDRYTNIQKQFYNIKVF